VRPIPRRHHVTAVDIDASHLDELAAIGDNVITVHADFLIHDFDNGFDLCITNPPYEGGMASSFIERAIIDVECARAVAILRAAFLHSASRWERVWRLVDITKMAILVNSDFVVFELTRRHRTRRLGEPMEIGSVEWWRV